MKGQDHRGAEVQARCRLSQLSVVSITQLPCGSYQRNKYERLENKTVRGRGEERGDKSSKEGKIKGRAGGGSCMALNLPVALNLDRSSGSEDPALGSFKKH